VDIQHDLKRHIALSTAIKTPWNKVRFKVTWLVTEIVLRALRAGYTVHEISKYRPLDGVCPTAVAVY
jgi:hypothetical protein